MYSDLAIKKIELYGLKNQISVSENGDDAFDGLNDLRSFLEPES